MKIAAASADFPILAQKINQHSLVYLDNAATTQKPRLVLDAERSYYETSNANVHRGVHTLSARATQAYQQARSTVARFVGAADPSEIIFVRNATEALNLVAQIFVAPKLQPGDELLVTHMEHHSNFVPWQQLAKQKKCVLKVVPVTDAGELDLSALSRMLTVKTKVLAVAHVSNVLGTINPIKEIVALAHTKGVPVVVDGAQAVGHVAVDVGQLGCDFYAFSGHKMYGPTGIGALFGKSEHLEKMPPFLYGGDMINSVTLDQTEFAHAPQRFEAGTPNIAGAIGLAAASSYLEQFDWQEVVRHERNLADHMRAGLDRIAGLRVIGLPRHSVGIVPFVIDGLHPHDVATVLDSQGIAVRSGHACAQPLLTRLGLTSIVRASCGIYNTTKDVDQLVAGVRQAITLLK
jgi:cysteine desulfurase/selenocysteine lyase